MAEVILAALLSQTLLLAVLAAALLVLRRPMLARFGAGLAYARWTLLPLTLLVSVLPVAAPVKIVTARLVPQLGLVRAPALVPTHAPTSSASAWLALWLAGTFVLLAMMGWQQRRLMRGITRDGTQWWAAAGEGPALVGLLRPRLVLPRDFAARFDATEQRLVVAHEDVHRRRLDNLWNLLAALLCAVHWFNPLAWLALRGLRGDQELACDAAVMSAHPGQEAPYGRALLAAQTGAASLVLPWARWTSPHPLVERTAMLGHHLVSRQRRLVGRVLLAAAALLAAGFVHAFNAAPPPSPDAQQVWLSLHITVNDPVKGLQTFKPSLVVQQGETARIVIDGREPKPAGTPIALELTPSVQADGKIMVGFNFDPSRPELLQIQADGFISSMRDRKTSMLIEKAKPAHINWTDGDRTEFSVDLDATVLKPQQ